ncbi:protein of unknown function [Pseudodesulfovibrio profundus]|uniref:Phage protein n=1 Tax=Pseudodesulfovibrio profundus TaxID=57320 RepID=A0A2C8FCU6_9BACT|nr:hypothetical protein [Pseudodesulfovibrio profundus]SOB60604.1 protein of unknown function [Pseudodesulfovibrio profundus]
MIVVSCFDHSTNMVKPWAEAGYTCYCVDIQHPEGEHREGNIIKVGADMLDWMLPREEIAFAAFFPPCTNVAVSGARWFRDKGIGALWRALRLFDVSVKLAELSGAPDMLNVLERCLEREYNPFEHDNQSSLYHDLSAVVAKAKGQNA